MDLSTTSVFLDFDGTIATADTGVHLLERFARDDWRAVDRQYAAGTIGSREALSREWAMLPREEAALRAAAREVPLDPALGPLVEGLRSAGAEILVVSDGFGFHVAEALTPFGLAVLTNAVDFERGALEFPNMDRCCPCSTCGTCKQAPIKDARRRGRVAVFVGDGVSDRKAALLADRLFAKVGPGGRPDVEVGPGGRPDVEVGPGGRPDVEVGPGGAPIPRSGLAEWCESADVPYEPFTTLADVHAALLGEQDLRSRARN